MSEKIRVKGALVTTDIDNSTFATHTPEAVIDLFPEELASQLTRKQANDILSAMFNTDYASMRECYICKGKNGHHEIHCSAGRCSCFDGSGIICQGSLDTHPHKPLPTFDLREKINKILFDYYQERKIWDVGLSVTEGRTELQAKFIDQILSLLRPEQEIGDEIYRLLLSHHFCQEYASKLTNEITALIRSHNRRGV